MTRARLGVVLVNWNRWADTIECLESLSRASIPLRIVVVDNASSDGSADRIVAWAEGTLIAAAAEPAMSRFSSPPSAKPVAIQRLAAGATGGDAWLTLIDAGGNLGFAGGNNLGLRHLLADPDIVYVWLLNNDTVVDTEAPGALLSMLDATPNVGMCGTVVRFYYRPDTQQALNGSRFSSLTGTSRSIGGGMPADLPFEAAAVTSATDFVLGASLAVSRAFVSAIGPMEESYFLYFEEIDWSWRNAGRFATAFAPGAVVYHKEGGSIGSSSLKGGRSELSEYYLVRSRLKLVARHRPWLLPAHWAVTVAQIARRLARRQPGKARVMTRALFGRSYEA